MEWGWCMVQGGWCMVQGGYMVRRGVVRYDYRMDWGGVVQGCSMVHYSMVWSSMVRCAMVRCSMVRWTMRIRNWMTIGV